MDFTVNLTRDTSWAMQTAHFHDELEILLSLTDGGSFFLMNNLHPMRRGTLLILQGQVPHRSISSEGPYERYVMHIPRETLTAASSEKTSFPAMFAHNYCIHLDETSFMEIYSLLERCRCESEGPGSDILRECAFRTLLVMVGRQLEETSISDMTSDEFSLPVRQTIDWICAHLTEDLSLDILAEQCDITKYHLCRLFKDETSFTVGEYITRLRLLRASALLRAGESVQRAGESSGFQSNAHFIRTFGRFMGMSPGRYQRQYRGHRLPL